MHLYDTAEDAIAAGYTKEQIAGTSGNGAYGWVAPDDKGVLHAHFIVDQIEQGTELGKFLHEVGGHIGIDNILDKATIDRLFWHLVGWADAGNEGDTSVEAQAAMRARERTGTANTPDTQIKSEIITYFLEEAVALGVNPTAMNYKSDLGRWFWTLWAAFKVALRKLGVHNVDSLTAQNLVDLAYGAARLELNGHWHGSLPAFRNFDSKYMSSGAGDQWYGWGHYVAKRKGIGEHYREMVVQKNNKASGDDKVQLYIDGESWAVFTSKCLTENSEYDRSRGQLIAPGETFFLSQSWLERRAHRRMR